MNKTISVLIIGFLFISSVNAVIGKIQTKECYIENNNDVDAYILNEMDKKHIPGLSASIVILK